ncbi:Cytochrome c oxidase assembly factor 6 like protein [Willisornis vidua]|uniref:Cytochrome c oxidase assembly factor 6 like protein n=1 Tax=Willisornis vidua TaxID=1566151 RepID=A0ABQ9DVB2_9PASS|nr:Cytochrome c oxidase assembly factor 6 like protein [Willisornis vidua]
MAAPTRQERAACWGARDEFWQCLDSHADDAAKCEKLRRAFESRCPQQWVSTARRGPGSTRSRSRSAKGGGAGPEGYTAGPALPLLWMAPHPCQA